MPEYGRDWTYRRRRPYRSRYRYGRPDHESPFEAERPHRRPGRHFTGFRREPGIEEGFGYGAGTAGYHYEFDYGPERGYRRRMRSYPPEREYRTQRGYHERGYQSRRPGYEIERGYTGRGYGFWAEYGQDAEPEYGYDVDFSRWRGYGHTPVDRWPEFGHDLDNLESAEIEMDDNDVREAVLENLFQDSWIDPERIDVHVDRGVVTLAGEVRDFMEARYAWDDAWESAGVRGVINNLTVRADLPQEGMEFPQTGGG